MSEDEFGEPVVVRRAGRPRIKPVVDGVKKEPARKKSRIEEMKKKFPDDYQVAEYIVEKNKLPEMLIPHIVKLNQLALDGKGAAQLKSLQMVLQSAMGIDKKKTEVKASLYEFIEDGTGEKDNSTGEREESARASEILAFIAG